MGRSIKKGPYVQPVLLKRVQEMNEAGVMDKTAMVFGQMNEAPGVRMSTR